MLYMSQVYMEFAVGLFCSGTLLRISLSNGFFGKVLPRSIKNSKVNTSKFRQFQAAISVIPNVLYDVLLVVDIGEELELFMLPNYIISAH